MYKLRPLVPTPVIKDSPSSMYKMKSYFEITNSTSCNLTAEVSADFETFHLICSILRIDFQSARCTCKCLA